MEIVRKSRESERLPETHSSLIQLKDLKKYKILCEQRILELCPDHPMPIQESHLGSSLSQISELQMARQKISKLESHIEKLSDLKFSNTKSGEESILALIQEKELLEETLRAEMLSSEEQRAYIEMLKQALEAAESGRNGMEIGNFEGNGKLFDLKRENANLKSVVKDLQDQVEKTKKILKDAEEGNKKASREKQEFYSDAQEMQENVNYYKEQLHKMEEEKNSLLEYIEDHSQKEAEMQAEMNDLEILFEELKNNYSETFQKLQQELEENEKNTEKIQELKTELDRKTKIEREVQNSNDILKSQLTELKANYKKLKDEKMTLEVKNENLQANFTTLSETLKETQEEIEYYQDSLEKIQKNLSEKESSIEKLKTECFEKSQEISTLKSINNSLEQEKVYKTDEKNEVLKDFEKERQKFMLVTKKCEDFQVQNNKLVQELSARNGVEKQVTVERETNKELQREIFILKNENFELSNKERELNNQLDELRKMNNLVKEEREGSLKQVCVLNEEIVRLRNELEEFEKMAVENKELHELLSMEKAVNEDFIDSDREVAEGNFKIFQRNEEVIRILQNKNEEDEVQIRMLKEEVRDVRIHVENLENVFLSLRNRVLSSVRVILENLPIDNLELMSYLNENFKKNIYSLDSGNDPLQDITCLCTFSEEASKHLNYIQDINKALQEDISNKSYELSLNINRIEALSHEIDSQSLNFSLLTQRLEQSYKENLSLKSNYESLTQENYELTKSLEKSFMNLKSLKATSDQSENTIKALEFEIRSLNTEKHELQELIRTQKSENYKENLCINNELEGLERNRLELQCQLLKYQSDPRSKDGVMFKELGNRLYLCEKELRNYYSSFTPCSRERDGTPLRRQTFREQESHNKSNRLRADSSQTYREKSLYFR